jgi:hypothetical protein
MKLRVSIFWVLFLQCLIFADFSSECPQFSDPNTYIDDPNTLDNGLFECGDPNLTEEYDFNAPFFWERTHFYVAESDYPDPNDCYAALHCSFDPNQSEVEWTIESPYSGEKFLLLHTGHPDPEYPPIFPSTPQNVPSSAIKKSQVSQKVVLEEGDTIQGAYFFGTIDYLKFSQPDSYNDYGLIYLEPVDPGNEPNDQIIIAMCDVATVGSRESTLALSEETGGWIRFSHTVEDPNQAGSYFLRCEVADDDDEIVDSYFAIDGLRICRGGQPDADLDWDCDVDLNDYSILSKAWLSFCPDPNFYDPNFYNPNDYPPVADPNFVNYDADLDDDWYVDANDLIIMSSEWLSGLLSE